MPSEKLLVHTLLELADSLVDNFDVVDLLSLLAYRCVEVLDLAAAGVMLVAPEGDLRVIASSSEATRVVELFELQADEGPCLDCYRTGEAVIVENLSTVNRQRSLASFRPGGPGRRLSIGRCPAHAHTGLDHRRPQPFRL